MHFQTHSALLPEALSLTTASAQADGSVIAIRTLKTRGRIAVREVPVPDRLVRLLCTRHDRPDALLRPLGRTCAWRRVKEVMGKAGITGRPALPRGLRHGFGIHAVQCGVPLNLVQKWLGHANIATAAIYTNAIGLEEREIAQRMW